MNAHPGDDTFRTSNLPPKWRALADLGFSLIPLRPREKIPVGKWERYQTERASPEQLAMWAANDSLNIGVVTGAISGVIVLDLDSPQAIAHAEGLGLPRTPAVQTANGEHHYYAHPGGTLGNRAKFLPGMDLRGDGGYVAAPGSIHPTGAEYTWKYPPETCELAAMPAWLTEALAGKSNKPKGRPFALAELAVACAELRATPEGGRNDALNRAAFRLARLVHKRQLDGDYLKEQLRAAAADAGLDAGEIEKTLDSGYGDGLSEARKARGGNAEPPGPEQPGTENADADIFDDEPSEDAFARAFTRKYGGSVKYCHSCGSWFWWTGGRWEKNERKLAFHFFRAITRELSGGSARFSKASVAAGAESFARADPAHAVDAAHWDRDPFLLGTPTGTVHLRTGELLEPDPGHAITKLTFCGPEPGEPSLWLRFLYEATGGDADMIRYLQQVCGYMLTGDTREHALFFLYGPGGNGKSVFLNTLAGILADYATTAAMDTFTASKSDRHPADLAMLKGARLVSASETEEGRAWAEARIKQLTGGDRISARFMRQNFFEFTPEFKLLIVGNHAPVLHNVDEAARRRFNVIPFTFKPEKPDRQLEEKLKAEWPRILTWMIEGCLDWQASGLTRPEVVRAATEDYFEAQDVMGQWLAERCEIGAGFFELAGPLYKDWSAFADGNGEPPGSAKSFGTEMARRGFRAAKKHGHRLRVGLKLRHGAGQAYADQNHF